jgi:hypothetical protein
VYKRELKIMVGINLINPFQAELLFPCPKIRPKDGGSSIVASLSA